MKLIVRTRLKTKLPRIFKPYFQYGKRKKGNSVRTAKKDSEKRKRNAVFMAYAEQYFPWLVMYFDFDFNKETMS